MFVGGDGVGGGCVGVVLVGGGWGRGGGGVGLFLSNLHLYSWP